MREYFKVLGLPQNATYEEVKNARIKLLKKYHPDCYVGSKKFAQIKTAEINQAFAFLTKYYQDNGLIKRGNEDNLTATDSNKKNSEEKNKIEEDKEIIINKLQKKEEKKEKERKEGKRWIDFSIYILILIIILLIIVFTI